MTIQYAVPIPEKSHVLHVGLLVPNSVEKVDPVTGVVTMADGIQEIPVRKSHYESLTSSKKLTYAKECAEFHHPTARAKAQARREAWDADDLAKEQARFVTRNPRLVDGQVAVDVTHKGWTTTVTIPNEPANAEANARTAFDVAYQAKVDADAALAGFTMG
jgi:hypothetical protein